MPLTNKFSTQITPKGLPWPLPISNPLLVSADLQLSSLSGLLAVLTCGHMQRCLEGSKDVHGDDKPWSGRHALAPFIESGWLCCMCWNRVAVRYDFIVEWWTGVARYAQK